MTVPHLEIPPDTVAPPVPCERCGYRTVHVAEVIGQHGRPMGNVLVCTRCQGRQYDIETVSR
ncbi:hypothetical protein [Amycolatopsis anabasis]|uniref:hypothetical protein n=1 Tax=Amycolatopsis anabasis TaxID=1840409 RepID=UPI00131D959F|nr:hypothetical protein [Amycolatopsis anabasis]